MVSGAVLPCQAVSSRNYLDAITNVCIPPCLPACLSACQAALDALAAVTETIRKEDSVMYIKHIRKALAAMASADPTLAETGVPGFNLKKGLAPLLPILKHGLMFGTH